MNTSWRVRHIALGGGISVYPAFAARKQAMEMTEYGSMESHEAGFPPFPYSLEIPLGLPHSHGLDDWIYIFSYLSSRTNASTRGL
jgi:hypothetical protein